MSSVPVPLEPQEPETGVPYARFGQDAAEVPAYKWWAVFNIACCCLPLGVAAAYFAGEVEERVTRGDYPGAKNASNTARIVNIVATIFGLAAYSISIACYMVLIRPYLG